MTAQLQYTIQNRTVLIISPLPPNKHHSSDVVYQRRGGNLNCEGCDGEVLWWLKSQPTNTIVQVLLRCGSSDGDRQRILLGVTSCKPAHRRFWCDGRPMMHEASTLGISYQKDRAALFKESTALSRQRRSHEKRL